MEVDKQAIEIIIIFKCVNSLISLFLSTIFLSYALLLYIILRVIFLI